MESNATFRLVVQRGPQPDKVFALVKDAISIGRDASNDIAIGDPEISRRHARLIRQAGGYAVEDLGSTNGTFVNGGRISTLHVLEHGDELGFGETVTVLYQALVDSVPATVVGMAAAPLPDATVAADAGASPFSAPPHVEPEPEPDWAPAEEPYGGYSEPAPEPVQYAEPAYEPPAQTPPPPPFGAQQEYSSQPSYAYEPEPPPPPPSRPAPTAMHTPPPAYESYEPYAPVEEKKPKSRKKLLIGCGCLLLLLLCAIVGGIGYFLWTAPPEFFDDPLGYLGFGGLILPWLSLLLQ